MEVDEETSETGSVVADHTASSEVTERADTGSVGERLARGIERERDILAEIRRRTQELESLVPVAESIRNLQRARAGTSPSNAIDLEATSTTSFEEVPFSSSSREQVAVARLVTPGALETERAREHRWAGLHQSATELGLHETATLLEGHLARVREYREFADRRRRQIRVERYGEVSSDLRFATLPVAPVARLTEPCTADPVTTQAPCSPVARRAPATKNSDSSLFSSDSDSSESHVSGEYISKKDLKTDPTYKDISEKDKEDPTVSVQYISKRSDGSVHVGYEFTRTRLLLKGRTVYNGRPYMSLGVDVEEISKTKLCEAYPNHFCQLIPPSHRKNKEHRTQPTDKYSNLPLCVICLTHRTVTLERLCQFCDWTFHTDCWDSWIASEASPANNTCPGCRQFVCWHFYRKHPDHDPVHKLEEAEVYWEQQDNYYHKALFLHYPKPYIAASSKGELNLPFYCEAQTYWTSSRQSRTFS